ncbi:hypothetical protein LINGRAHAP2_LOCUS24086 [Linum grandiflorum]
MPRREVDFTKLKNYGLKEFKGESGDPRETVDWLNESAVVFDFMGATPIERLKYTSFLLRGHALRWWRYQDVGKVTPPPPPITFKEFLRRFQALFLSQQWVQNKEIEFATLKQGGMSVLEYHIKFTELSEWYHGQGDRDGELRNRFLNGLRLSLQEGISSGDMGSMEAIKQAVLRKEHIENARKAERKEKEEDKKRKAGT